MNGDRLTKKGVVIMLFVPFPYETVRGGSRKNQEMPITARHGIVCAIKKHNVNGERYSGGESPRSSLATSSNLFDVHRPIFGRIKRCPLIFKREHTMNDILFSRIKTSLDSFNKRCNPFLNLSVEINPR